MNQIQTQKEAYYKKVGVAPGVPTAKGAYGDPENTGVGYNAVLTELGNHDDALREIEAEQGTKTYNAFRDFVKTHFKASVENLFKNDKLKEKDKIEQINKWWNEFKKQTSNKK